MMIPNDIDIEIEDNDEDYENDPLFNDELLNIQQENSAVMDEAQRMQSK